MKKISRIYATTVCNRSFELVLEEHISMNIEEGKTKKICRGENNIIKREANRAQLCKSMFHIMKGICILQGFVDYYANYRL